MAYVAEGSAEVSFQPRVDIPFQIATGSAVINAKTKIDDTGFWIVNADTGDVIGGLYEQDGTVYLGASALKVPGAPDGALFKMVTKNMAGNVGTALLAFLNGAEIGGLYADSVANNPAPINSMRLYSCSDLFIDSDVDKNGDTSGSALWLSKVDGESAIQTIGRILPSFSGIDKLGSTAKRYVRLYCTQAPDVSSDARQKDFAGDVPEGFVLKLRPRLYRRKDDPERKLRMGLYAQEVKEAMDACGLDGADLYGGEDPDSLSLRYEELIAPLIATVQAQQRRIEALEARLPIKDAEV